MSERLEVRETRLGKGVFALSSIQNREILMEWRGERLTRAQLPNPYLNSADFCTQVGEDTFIGPSGELDDYTNHSCQPNSGLRFEGGRVYLVAIRNIQPQEEVVWDYATTVLDDWEMNCDCKSPKCRKIIGKFSLVPKEIQQKYISLGIVPEYVIKGS